MTRSGRIVLVSLMVAATSCRSGGRAFFPPKLVPHDFENLTEVLRYRWSSSHALSEETAARSGAQRLDFVYGYFKALSRFERALRWELLAEDIAGHRAMVARLPASGKAKRRVVATAGIHGNELHGPAVARALAAARLSQPECFETTDLVIVPVVNPSGLMAGTREDVRDGHKGVNLNRDDERPRPTRDAVVALLAEAHPGDLWLLDIHAAWRAGDEGLFVLQKADHDGFFARAFAEFGRWAPILSDSIQKTELYPGEKPARYLLGDDGLHYSNNEGTLSAFGAQAGASVSVTIEVPRVGRFENRWGDQTTLTWELIRALFRVGAPEAPEHCFARPE